MIIKTQTTEKISTVTKFFMEKVDGKWQGTITLTATDENNIELGQDFAIINRESWNAFWDTFNSGAALDNTANTLLGIQGTVENTSEAEYRN